MQPLTVGLIIPDREILAEVEACLHALPVRVLLQQPEAGDWAALSDKLDRLRPDVLLVGLSGLLDQLETAIPRMRRTAGAPVVVAIHTATSPDSILRAIRAGASEYLYPPLRAGLESALERISTERATQRGHSSRGKAIGFLSVKGGCGATTLASHTGLEIQRATGQEVLMADLDLDAGMFGFLFKSKSEYTILDAMNHLNRLDLSFWKALVSNGIPGVEVISAPLSSSSSYQPGEHDRLRQVLRFAKGQYDWVVADLGRSLGINVMSCLEEVDSIYMVTTGDVPALYRARLMLRRLRDSGCDAGRLHVILNRVPKRNDITASELASMLGAPIAATIPEDAEAVYECHAEGRFLAPGSPIGRRIVDLAVQITGAKPGHQKKRFSLLG